MPVRIPALLFPSPYSGILFYGYMRSKHQFCVTKFPSPHSGILFLLKTCLKMKQSVLRKCFRPLIRGFFFYQGRRNALRPPCIPVSVPSFGDSFFITPYAEHGTAEAYGFRPLIRGFFFYSMVVYWLLQS